MRVSPAALYPLVFGSQARIGDFNLGYAYLAVFVVVAALFLIIEAGALVMGLALARSITGAVHELFVGTGRVQQGDFTHRIQVRTRDQLGELAESFNTMTASVRDLLLQVGEKKRLEEELRIAHEVQMSLLPRDSVTIPGLDVTGACIRPARSAVTTTISSVLGERRLGVLVADVSGKGTPAAFYMAELKGAGAVAQPHPRVAAADADRGQPSGRRQHRERQVHHDDVCRHRHRQQHADVRQSRPRAAHPRPRRGRRRARGGARRPYRRPGGVRAAVETLIEEETHAIEAGDLVALYTDGVTEAMNTSEEQFGEQRLVRALEEHRGADVAAVREEVLGGVSRFVGAARQHDDMTVVLLKVRGGEGA